MKRSEINHIIKEAVRFFTSRQFILPEWAFWSPDKWKGSYEKCSEIVDNKLGWDITDFGSGDFRNKGLTLFTLRNGNLQTHNKIYCEKIMISGEEQETPTHFHWKKTEDIINRGGGNLVIELWHATSDDKLSDEDVIISIDGIRTIVKPGERLILYPGQSVCLPPRLYHKFYGEKGLGKVLIGEVSEVNDDDNDNRFFDNIGRFPQTEEDTEPLHLLVKDYPDYL